MSSDVRISRWRMSDRRASITFEQEERATRFYRLPQQFVTTPDMNSTLVTLLDIVQHQKNKMANYKPEVEITFEQKQMAKRFQRLPHIFDHVRPEYDTADIV